MGFSLRYFQYQNIFTEKLREVNGSVKDLVSVNLVVASMADYAVINSEYVRRFGVNPPVRVCVQGPISNKVNMYIHVNMYSVFFDFSYNLSLLEYIQLKISNSIQNSAVQFMTPPTDQHNIKYQSPFSICL